MSSIQESSHRGLSPPHEKNGSAESSGKRRRIALACLDCRRRKLKCDRIFPACSRCQKDGHPETCTYDANAVDLMTERPSVEYGRGQGHPENHPNVLRKNPNPNYLENHQPLAINYNVTARMQSHIEQLENRVVGLERALLSNQQLAGPSNTDKPIPKPQYDMPWTNPGDEEFMTFRGKGYKTSFYGATHNASCFNHLCSLKPFMKEMMVQQPDLLIMQKKIRASRVSRPSRDETGYTGVLLYKYLPARPIADRLLEFYSNSFERTYRVLHLPSFWSEYDRMWENLSNARPLFVSLVLLTLASMTCMAEQGEPLFRGDSSLARERAIGWIDACDSFLDSQSQKHITLNYLQARVISFIAKVTNSVKKKRTWTSAGTLMDFAVSAGLHRDVESLNNKCGREGPRRRVSYFDQEMRRRLWSTISELELQSAIQRGMPASLPDLVVDCGPPCNSEDEDIDPGMDYKPPSRPISAYTRSTFLHIMSTSWDLRRSVVSSINGSSRPLGNKKRSSYDLMICKALDGIPPWQGTTSEYSSSLIQLEFQQLLTFVHRPVIDKRGSPYIFEYFSTEHLKAAQATVDLHYQLWKSGNGILLAFREDLLGAGLSICHAVESAQRLPDSPVSTRIMTTATVESVQGLEKALGMLENKVMRLGVGLHDYYAISSCIGLLKHMTSKNRKDEEFEAAGRITKLMGKLLSLEDNYSAAATLASLPNMSVNASNNGDLPNEQGNAQPTGAESVEFENNFTQINNFDLETQDWDFETFFAFA